MLVEAYLFAGGEDVDGQLGVVAGELQGFVELLFGEDARTVEVVETALAVVPAADIAVVLQRMLHYGHKPLTGMAALRGSIGHGDALGGRLHRANVDGEAVGPELAEAPYTLGNSLGRCLLVAPMAARRSHHVEDNKTDN